MPPADCGGFLFVRRDAERKEPGAMPRTTINDRIRSAWESGATPVTFCGGEGEPDAAAKAASEKEAADKTAADAKARADADEALKLGEPGKAALKAERDARAAAEKAHKDATAELETLRKEKADAVAAKAAADEQDAIKKGEFEKLANDRQAALDAAKAEATSNADKIAAYEKAIAPMIESLEKELPKEAMSDYDKEADPAIRLQWLQTRKELVATLRPTDPNKPRVGVTPRPNGNDKPEIKPLPVAY